MAKIDRAVPLLTVIFAPGSEPQRQLAAALTAAFAQALRVNLVPATAAIGRDLTEAARILLLDWRLPADLPHLRELLQVSRGKTIVCTGLAAGDEPAAAAVVLRRFAGRVLTPDPLLAAKLQDQVRVPVQVFDGRDAARGIAAALPSNCQDLDDVGVHLQDAQAWLQRGAHQAALASASRALVLSPDQPGIIADTARILHQLGRVDDAASICRSYLLQRPESAPVRTALHEVLASRS